MFDLFVLACQEYQGYLDYQESQESQESVGSALRCHIPILSLSLLGFLL